MLFIFIYLNLFTTAKNTVILSNFLVWEFCGKANHPKLCGNCAFEQNFHTKKLGEITLFFVVYSSICFPLRRVTKKIEFVLYFSKWIVSLLGTNHSQTWLISVSSIYQIHPELMHDDISFAYIRHYKRLLSILEEPVETATGGVL